MVFGRYANDIYCTEWSGLRVTPIRRNTPLYSKLLDKPRPLPANLGMNYWKGQSWAPWWGWHIWLAERSNWHSLRNEEKGHCYLSSSELVQWLCLKAGPYHITYWAFTQLTPRTTYVTDINIKIPTTVLMAVIYQTQKRKILMLPYSECKMGAHIAPRSQKFRVQCRKSFRQTTFFCGHHVTFVSYTVAGKNMWTLWNHLEFGINWT